MDHLMSSSIHTLFITGTGRSGTNILKKLMAGHSAIASLPFEYRFLIDPKGVLDFYRSYPACWSPYRADQSIKELESFLLSLARQDDVKRNRTTAAKAKDPVGLTISPPPYSGWELEEWIPGYTEYVHELIGQLRSFSYPAIWPGTKEGVENNEMYFTPPVSEPDLDAPVSTFIQTCLESIRKKQGKTIFQEDNTHNMLFASSLLKLVPEGKMVHIVRDPRDVLSSLQQQRWAPTEIEHLIAWYSGVMKTWFSEREHCQADKIKEIRFEDLMESPKKTLNELCSFVGIELEEQMLSIDLSQHHQGRYKDSFIPEEVKLIERSLDWVFEEYQYPTS